MSDEQMGPTRFHYNMAIVRGDAPFPDTKEPEPPCCVPNAHGACSSTCPRVAYNRGHVRDSEQAQCAGRDLIPSRTA